jgi:ABC-2 type transport system ATP-binding protein
VEAVCDRVQIMHHGNIVYTDTIAALKRVHSDSTVLVGLRRPPPLEVIAAVPGVAGAEQVEQGLFQLRFCADADAADALVRRAAEGNWGLYRMQPAQTSLEDVFVNLTRSEESQ